MTGDSSREQFHELTADMVYPHYAPTELQCSYKVFDRIVHRVNERPHEPDEIIQVTYSGDEGVVPRLSISKPEEGFIELTLTGGLGAVQSQSSELITGYVDAHYIASWRSEDEWFIKHAMTHMVSKIMLKQASVKITSPLEEK